MIAAARNGSDIVVVVCGGIEEVAHCFAIVFGLHWHQLHGRKQRTGYDGKWSRPQLVSVQVSVEDVVSFNSCGAISLFNSSVKEEVVEEFNSVGLLSEEIF